MATMSPTLSAAGVSITANGKPLGDFLDALKLYQKRLGNEQHVAIRRGLINLLKSLRALTAIAPKQVRLNAVRRYTGAGPHYLTPKGGGDPLPRWSVTRRAGSSAEHEVHGFAADKKAAREKLGNIRRRGLAKLAWAKLQAGLFKNGNPPKEFTAREPASIVDGFFRVRDSFTAPTVAARIHNKLKYASDALKGTLDDALVKAKNSILAQFSKEAVKARNELK